MNENKTDMQQNFSLEKALFDHYGKKVSISKSQYEVTYK